MKDLQRSGLTREQWSAMTLYEKFEQVVIFVLSVIIAAIVVASVWALMREVVNRLVLGAFDTLDYATFQVVFGMIFTVVIALEFKRSLLVATERSFGILQVRTIVGYTDLMVDGAPSPHQSDTTLRWLIDRLRS